MVSNFQKNWKRFILSIFILSPFRSFGHKISKDWNTIFYIANKYEFSKISEHVLINFWLRTLTNDERCSVSITFLHNILHSCSSSFQNTETYIFVLVKNLNTNFDKFRKFHKIFYHSLLILVYVISKKIGRSFSFFLILNTDFQNFIQVFSSLCRLDLTKTLKHDFIYVKLLAFIEILKTPTTFGFPLRLNFLKRWNISFFIFNLEPYY